MALPDESRRDWAFGPFRARGQRHRDAPISTRERIVWRLVWFALSGAAIALIVFMLLR
ncbi:MAG: hypothetical protein ABR600_10975 [Actinomycetota bacterium]